MELILILMAAPAWGIPLVAVYYTIKEGLG